jgi:ribosome maturation protein SDO1
MANVEARIRIKEKHYEILVDLDEALKIQKGEGDITQALQSNNIYYDLKKGTIASESDLNEAFGITNIHEVAKHIIQKGEVTKTQEFRDEKREEKRKQIINLILKNAVDQHGNPYTESRIDSAIKEVRYNFDNRPAEQQMTEIVSKLKEIIPIKIEIKKIKLVVPAQYTGQVYGLLQDYKESEEWLSNGNLQVVLNIPAGLSIDFFDKLNSMTHGSIQSDEIKTDQNF